MAMLSPVLLVLHLEQGFVRYPLGKSFKHFIEGVNSKTVHTRYTAVNVAGLSRLVHFLVDAWTGNDAPQVVLLTISYNCMNSSG